jgi:hypothetical protein
MQYPSQCPFAAPPRERLTGSSMRACTTTQRCARCSWRRTHGTLTRTSRICARRCRGRQAGWHRVLPVPVQLRFVPPRLPRDKRLFCLMVAGRCEQQGDRTDARAVHRAFAVGRAGVPFATAAAWSVAMSRMVYVVCRRTCRTYRTTPSGLCAKCSMISQYSNHHPARSTESRLCPPNGALALSISGRWPASCTHLLRQTIGREPSSTAEYPRASSRHSLTRTFESMTK